MPGDLQSRQVSLLRRLRPVSKATVADKLLSDYILYAVGLMYLYNFVVHTVFAETSAAFIGWANSPFQYEVGYASVGCWGLGGWRRLLPIANFTARLVAVIGSVAVPLGCGSRTYHEILKTKNFSPGNAGVEWCFWTIFFFL